MSPQLVVSSSRRFFSLTQACLGHKVAKRGTITTMVGKAVQHKIGQDGQIRKAASLGKAKWRSRQRQSVPLKSPGRIRRVTHGQHAVKHAAGQWSSRRWSQQSTTARRWPQRHWARVEVTTKHSSTKFTAQRHRTPVVGVGTMDWQSRTDRKPSWFEDYWEDTREKLFPSTRQACEDRRIWGRAAHKRAATIP